MTASPDCASEKVDIDINILKYICLCLYLCLCLNVFVFFLCSPLRPASPDCGWAKVDIAGAGVTNAIMQPPPPPHSSSNYTTQHNNIQYRNTNTNTKTNTNTNTNTNSVTNAIMQPPPPPSSNYTQLQNITMQSLCRMHIASDASCSTAQKVNQVCATKRRSCNSTHYPEQQVHHNKTVSFRRQRE